MVSAQAQEMPDGVIGARRMTRAGAVISAGTVALTIPLVIGSQRSGNLGERVLYGIFATAVGAAGATVATPLLVLGTRRGVSAWEAAGASPAVTGVRFATTGGAMAGLGLGALIAGVRLDSAGVMAGEPIVVVGLSLLCAGAAVAGAGAVMQWTAFPEATPLFAWTVPLGGRR